MTSTTRPTAMQIEYFNPRVLDLYWRFLAERQAIWLRRSEGLPPPWTADPILQVEFITNVYRQLDPGTEYLVSNILSADAPDEAKVFNVMLYRLMGSKPETHQHIGFLDPKKYKAAAVADRLRELPDDYRIFGDAYRVASYMTEGSDNKIDNVTTMFAYIAKHVAETTRRVKSSGRVVEVYKVFESMQGFGEFLSHQIVVDLLYPDANGEKLVPFTDDEFAKAGPGARKGIWALLAEGVKPANLTIVLEWLRDQQVEEFQSRDIIFPFLAGEGDQPHLMSVCDIQASLCEFYKYYRLWSGERAVQVRKYDGPHRDVTSRDVMMPSDEARDEVVARVGLPYTYQMNDEAPDEVADRIVDDGLEDEPVAEQAQVERAQGSSTHEFNLGDGRTVAITININLG